MRIAVTGNIGSGKSTFVEMLKQHLPNFSFFSVDALVRQLYELDSFKDALKARFGTKLGPRSISPESFTIEDVAKFIFEFEDDRKWLEAQSRSHMEGLVRDSLSDEHVVMEYPLLFELGWHLNRFDFIIAVTCPDAQREARIIKRDRVGEAKVSSILQSQCSSAAKGALADWEVVNKDEGMGAYMLEKEAERVSWAVKGLMLKERAMALFQSEEIWDELHRAYTTRHNGNGYHTLRHLALMFEHYDFHAASLAHPKAVAMAIFFHDFVYCTEGDESARNEANSVHQMYRLIKRYAPALLMEVEQGEPVVTVAAEMIMATVKHSVPVSYFGSRPVAAQDCAKFLDMDLSILLEPDFRFFEDGVRAEYAHIPADVYARERVKILKNFLNRERIFLSDEFSGVEHLARENLAALIKHLEQYGTSEAHNG